MRSVVHLDLEGCREGCCSFDVRAARRMTMTNEVCGLIVCSHLGAALRMSTHFCSCSRHSSLLSPLSSPALLSLTPPSLALLPLNSKQRRRPSLSPP